MFRRLSNKTPFVIWENKSKVCYALKKYHSITHNNENWLMMWNFEWCVCLIILICVIILIFGCCQIHFLFCQDCETEENQWLWRPQTQVCWGECDGLLLCHEWWPVEEREIYICTYCYFAFIFVCICMYLTFWSVQLFRIISLYPLGRVNVLNRPSFALKKETNAVR